MSGMNGSPRRTPFGVTGLPDRTSGYTVRALAVAAMVGLLAGCRPHPPAGHSATSAASASKTPPAAPAPAAPSVLQMGTLHLPSGKLFQKSGGRLVWETTMGPVDVSIGHQIGRINRVDALFYSSQRPVLRLKAADALVNYNQKTIVLDEGVTVTGLSQPAQFTADRVQWQWDRPNGLSADGHIRFQRESAVMTSGRLIGDVDLRKVRLLDHPEATLRQGA